MLLVLKDTSFMEGSAGQFSQADILARFHRLAWQPNHAFAAARWRNPTAIETIDKCMDRTVILRPSLPDETPH